MKTKTLGERCLDEFIRNVSFEFPMDGRGLGMDHDQIVKHAIEELTRLRTVDAVVKTLSSTPKPE